MDDNTKISGSGDSENEIGSSRSAEDTTRCLIEKVFNYTAKDKFRFGYVYSGSGSIRINDKVYDIGPGFTALVNIGDIIDLIPESQISYRLVELQPRFLTETLMSKISGSENCTWNLDGTVISKLDGLLEAYLEVDGIRNEYRAEYQIGLLKSIFAVVLNSGAKNDIIGNIEDISDKRKTTRGEKRTNVIRSAVMYVNQHFTEKLTMSEIAQMYDTQDQYFCRKFHEITGASFTDYVRNLRLQYAADLVKQTSNPIKEIYLQCGYTTKSHFMREFKKYYGISPLSMRKAYIREKIEQEKSVNPVRTGKKTW